MATFRPFRQVCCLTWVDKGWAKCWHEVGTGSCRVGGRFALLTLAGDALYVVVDRGSLEHYVTRSRTTPRTTGEPPWPRPTPAAPPKRSSPSTSRRSLPSKLALPPR